MTTVDALLAVKAALLPFAGRQLFEIFLDDGVHIGGQHFWHNCWGQVFLFLEYDFFLFFWIFLCLMNVYSRSLLFV